MSKYDFGYKIQEGSTTEWAYNIITPMGEVLEIGPAIGTLAKHLKEEKKCQVDIVEIDDDSGKMAEQFARNACIGQAKGDIEGEWWFNEYKNNRYDYIVLLDVIEHLRNPQMLLDRIYYLLKDNGKVLISTPNIAHNSVILNLMNNRFAYTDVGILDNTHLKFFTFDSFCELLHSSKYVITQKNYVQIRVGENEIKSQYSDVPGEVEAFLRKRNMADVYQFMFVLQKDGMEDQSDFPENLPYTNFKFETYLDGNLFSQMFFQNEMFETYIELGQKRSKCFRIDPMNTSGIISRVIIWDIENDCAVPIEKSNGGKLEENTFVFFDDDPQIIIDTEKTGSLLKFSCFYEVLDNKGVIFLRHMWEKLMESENVALDIKKQFDILYGHYLETEKEREKNEEQVVDLNDQYADLSQKFYLLQEQYNNLKTKLENSIVWKIYCKMVKKVQK